MKAPFALIAAAAFIGSTSLVAAFYAPDLGDVSSVQLVQDKMKDKKMMEEEMKDEKMAKDKMMKDDKMKDEKMMKDDKMKK